MCNVKELQHTLLEFDLLGVLRVWIEPRDAKTLPSLTIRRAVYDMLLRIPCQPDHLKRSGIGKTVVTLRKHKAELPENKAVLKAVMEKWSRPIFSKPGGGLHRCLTYSIRTVIA
jgi:transcription factor SPN1